MQTWKLGRRYQERFVGIGYRQQTELLEYRRQIHHDPVIYLAHRFQRVVQPVRSEEHTSELQSHLNLVCRLLLEKKKKKQESTNNMSINRSKTTMSWRMGGAQTTRNKFTPVYAEGSEHSRDHKKYCRVAKDQSAS